MSVAADFTYVTGEPVRAGDRVRAEGHGHGVVSRIFEAGTQEARYFACGETGGFMIEFDSGDRHVWSHTDEDLERFPVPVAITTSDGGGVFVIPPIGSLDDFRQWTREADFPDSGHIDFVNGVLEVDMSPQSIHKHGSVTIAIVETLGRLVRTGDLGVLNVERTRVVLPAANTSREPDVVFVSHESLDSGRVVETPRSKGGDDSWELVGPPDLVVEIVSDSSVKKDKVRLRAAFETAGLREYWIVDVRSGRVEVIQLIHDGSKFNEGTVSADGWFRCPTFGRDFRLSKTRGRRDRPIWRLEERGG